MHPACATQWIFHEFRWGKYIWGFSNPALGPGNSTEQDLLSYLRIYWNLLKIQSRTLGASPWSLMKIFSTQCVQYVRWTASTSGSSSKLTPPTGDRMTFEICIFTLTFPISEINQNRVSQSHSRHVSCNHSQNVAPCALVDSWSVLCNYSFTYEPIKYCWWDSRDVRQMFNWDKTVSSPFTSQVDIVQVNLGCIL